MNLMWFSVNITFELSTNFVDLHLQHFKVFDFLLKYLDIKEMLFFKGKKYF